MKPTLLALAALAVVPFELGCDLEDIADGGERYREEFQFTNKLEPGGRLLVDNFNGSVEILSWEKDSVQITGSKWASRPETLKEIKIEVKPVGNSIEIRTVRPFGIRGNMGAKYFIRAPRKIELQSVQSSNGSIRVEEIEGNVHLATSNGSIRMRRVVGRIDAHTSNASIEMDDVEGDALLRTSNGSIRLDRTRGGLEAHTSNASIHVAATKTKPGDPLVFESSNGSLDLAFTELANNEIRATTSNASITLRIPPSTKAQLRASTSNSSIASELDVMARGTIGKNNLEGELNGGGPAIRLSSSNGQIRLLRL